MIKISKKHLDGFSTVSKQVAQYGLVSCGSGNLSWRVNNEYMLITATGAWMSHLSKDEIVLCRIADGTSINGKPPSIEAGFHRAILRERQDVNVVLHFQSHYATILACSKNPMRNFFVIPEIPYYVGSVELIPYMNPGSDKLSQAVAMAIREHDLLILENHGQITVGRGFREALQRAVFFERACEIIIQAGKRVKTLSEKAGNFLYEAQKKTTQQPHSI